MTDQIKTLTAEARKLIGKSTSFQRGMIARDLLETNPFPKGEKRKDDAKDIPQEVLDQRAVREHQNLLAHAELAAINEALVAGEIEFKGQRQFVRAAR